MNNEGKIVFLETGTSQQGSILGVSRTSTSSVSESSSKSLSSTSQESSGKKSHHHQLYDASPELFQRLATLEVKLYNKRFTFQELNRATENFSMSMLIGEGAHSRVYQAVLGNGLAAAVKVLKTSQYTGEIFFREVEILSGLKHENVVQLLGYCFCREMCAIVYNHLSSSLKQRLNQLKWSERMQLALGLAKALDYLHSC